MARYSWRKNKDCDGLARYSQSYTLRCDGVELATAQRTGTGWHPGELWFWYGDKINTTDRPDTLENVKAEAVAYFKAKRITPITPITPVPTGR